MIDPNNIPGTVQAEDNISPNPDIGPAAAPPAAIGAEQLRNLTTILQQYKAGKSRLEQRVIAAENWWKLRNTEEERRETEVGKDKGFTAKSGWLHNVITSKHADAMESYPEPNILPREAQDKQEAKMLSSIVPCVLEQNKFEATYSDAMWDKAKFGTAIYKVIWDTSKLNGLGDIGVERVNVLNLFWEPTTDDVQKSPYLFHTAAADRDELLQQYPELEKELKSNGFVTSKFRLDEHNSKEADKPTIIECYYHKTIDGRRTLQYIKYVGETVLYATENEPELAQRGLYDHGRYPYVFDALYPIEGSPCGYGYVDLCKNSQTQIDLLDTSFLKNAMAGSIPRFLTRNQGGINEEEFLDLSNPLVHVNGDISEMAYRQVSHNNLDGNYIALRDSIINELRQNSGNTETSTGSTSSGVTAASAIAALQEASGKGSRDSTQASYRAYREIVELCIELIRQFYDIPRQFRITGQYGAPEYVVYSNAGITPQPQGMAFGMDMGMRLPVFDVKISAQRRNVYTKVTQNELAIQFYQLGIFAPGNTDASLMMLEMMEFDGKDELMQRIATMGSIAQKLMQYMQMALGMAQMCRPDLVELISMDMMQTQAQLGAAGMPGAAPADMPAPGASVTADSTGALKKKEHALVTNARARSAAATAPSGDPIRRK